MVRSNGAPNKPSHPTAVAPDPRERPCAPSLSRVNGDVERLLSETLTGSFGSKV